MDLLDTIAGDLASSEEDAAPAAVDEGGVSEADYVADLVYQQRAFMLEQALREAGVLPPVAGERPEKPYDEDLKKLIMSVPIE